MDLARINDLMEKMAAERKAGLQGARAEQLKTLIALNISQVEALYDAYGDNGNIDVITVTPEGIELDDAQDNTLRDFLWSVAYHLHPGFENNDGGYGKIKWDITKDVIDVDHNARFTDCTSYIHEDV